MGFLNNMKKAAEKQKGKEATNEAEKAHKNRQKFNLDLSTYSTEQIKDLNSADIGRIAGEVKHASPMIAKYYSGDLKTYTQIIYTKAQVEQNWVLIRQNEVIIRLLGAIDKQLH
jgi:hypothetical protein